MAQYRVLVRSFIDNHIREPGDIVEYDGEAGTNLEPIDGKPAKSGRRGRGAPAPEPEAEAEQEDEGEGKEDAEPVLA